MYYLNTMLFKIYPAFGSYTINKGNMSSITIVINNKLKSCSYRDSLTVSLVFWYRPLAFTHY